MRLDVGEFMRRFLLHVLPTGFHRIRHYSLFGNGLRADKLELSRRALNVPSPRTAHANSDNIGSTSSDHKPPRAGSIRTHTRPRLASRMSNAWGESGERHCRETSARWSAVVPLALEKRLFLNVRRKRLLVPLLGKKFCDINERLTSERFRSRVGAKKKGMPS